MPAFHARIALEAHDNLTGALIVNVLHVEVDTLTSPPNWGSIAADVHTWLGTPWNNILTTNETFDQVVVTDENYPGSTHGQGVSTVATQGARTLNDNHIDPAMCLVVSWKTAVAKRYARGHNFLPPATDGSAITGGGIFLSTSPYYVACNGFTLTFAGGHTAGSTSYVPEVFSRHQVALAATPFTFPITARSLPVKQRWLRSRSTAP